MRICIIALFRNQVVTNEINPEIFVKFINDHPVHVYT